MCDPATAAVVAGQTALSAIGSKAEIDSQNAAAVRNQKASIAAYNDDVAQTQAQYVEQNRSLIQGSFDAILAGRADEATAYTSAIQNGVRGGSVKALLRDRKQTTGRSKNRSRQEQQSLKTQTGLNLKQAYTTARGRINQVARTKWNLGDTAQALAPIVRSQMD